MSSDAAIIVTSKQVRELRRIKGINGEYLWKPSEAVGEYDTFCGWPLIVEDKRCAYCGGLGAD